MSLRTVRDRWTLFVGAVASVALGVALVQSSAVLLAAAGAARPPDGTGGASAEKVRTAVDSMTSLLGISLVLGVFLSVFIIGSTLSFTVTERRREIALLRLSGASRRQVRRLLLGEGLVTGLVGTAVGAALGLFATAVELRLVGRLGLDPGTLQVGFPGWTPVVDLGAGLGSGLAGVLVAARRASRVRPLDALRETGSQQRGMTWGRWLWALVFGVPAVVGAFVVQSRSDVLVAILVGLLEIVGGSLALQQLSPLVVPALSRLLALPVGGHVLGELARAGMRDGVRRTATTAGPLVILVGLVVGLLGILGTQTEATRIERIQSSTAQLVVLTPGDRLDEIRSIPGVAVASAESDVRLPVGLAGATGGWSPVESPAVLAVDPASYAELTKVTMTHGALDSLRPGQAVLGPSAAEDGLGSPSRVRVGQTSLTVRARMAETIAGGADVVVDRQDVPSAVLARAPSTTFVGLYPGSSSTRLRDRLAAVGRVSTVKGWAAQKAREETRDNNGAMLALAGLGGVYAFLSLINAVAIGTAQRRREFAVARVSGASRRQVVGATVLESVGVAAIGIALGAAAVGLCLAGLRHGTEAALGVPVMVVPWSIAVGIALAGVVASAATAAVSACSATRSAPVRLVAARE